MSNVLRWDELNILKQNAETFIREAEKRKPTAEEMDRWLGYMEYVLCLIYDYGWKDAEQIVGIVPFKYDLDDKAVNRELDGETFRDRVKEQVAALSLAGLIRIIETEAQRDYNTGVLNAAQQSGLPGIRKRWNTMGDERVRDTHSPLEGITVGLNDLFYTWDGDAAMAPGGFTLPQNNVNCRCWITLTT